MTPFLPPAIGTPEPTRPSSTAPEVWRWLLTCGGYGATAWEICFLHNISHDDAAALVAAFVREGRALTTAFTRVGPEGEECPVYAACVPFAAIEGG